MGWLTWLLDSHVFMPRSACGRWDSWVIALNILGNLLYAASYLAIPVSLAVFWHRRRDGLVGQGRILLWFVAFILCCSGHHWCNVLAFRAAPYRLFTLLDLIGGLVSLVTACLLPRVVNHILRLPSREFAHAQNERLQAQLAALELARAEDARQKAVLGRQVERLEAMRRTGVWVADQAAVIDSLRGLLRTPVTPGTDEMNVFSAPITPDGGPRHHAG